MTLFGHELPFVLPALYDRSMQKSGRLPAVRGACTVVAALTGEAHFTLHYALNAVAGINGRFHG